MLTAAFWLTAAQRAVKAFFHGLSVSLMATTALAHLSWPTALGTAGGMALLSLCSSISNAPIDDGRGRHREVLPPRQENR